MFEKKQKSLFTVETPVKATNPFIEGALKKGAETFSGNGAKKYDSTGNPFVDQFGSMSSYMVKRNFEDIKLDCEKLWQEDPLLATKFTFFVRTINRQAVLPDGTTTKEPQKGGELKNEGIMRMLWLSQKSPETFYNNLELFVSAGSWKDIFQMLQFDLMYHGWDNRVLDWGRVGLFLRQSAVNPKHTNLIRKYMPQIKSKSKCKTLESQADCLVAKWFSSVLFGSKTNEATSYRMYRKFKVDGNAHEWQQLISKGKFEDIDFGKIHGRALSLLVKSKFLTNQGLSDAYSEWVRKPENVTLKYTGFVHELLPQRGANSNLKETINKQFATLVKKGGEQKQTRLITAIDTSGSMESNAHGTNVTSLDVAKSIGIYFSEFLTGEFANSWIEFDSNAKLKQWVGDNPYDKFHNDRSEAYGSTDFQKVIDLFCILKTKGISEEHFPEGILCISDGEFNPAGLGKTNVDVALDKLRSAGFSKDYVDNFIMVFWNITNTFYSSKPTVKFETFGDVKNVFYFSGFSPSVITFLTNKIDTPWELFNKAMDQELLNKIVM